MKVTLNNIGKKYESREDFTLRHINLEIEDKDFCVILGPSGCGKTTLLRMIAGLNSITEGDLIFGEKRVNKLASKDRDIAMVFQSYALYPHMTVYDNMAFSLSMRKERKNIINERVNEAAKLVPLSNLALSTQCGFASTEEGNILSEADQWKKIKLVVDTANKIWK